MCTTNFYQDSVCHERTLVFQVQSKEAEMEVQAKEKAVQEKKKEKSTKEAAVRSMDTGWYSSLVREMILKELGDNHDVSVADA